MSDRLAKDLIPCVENSKFNSTHEKLVSLKFGQPAFVEIKYGHRVPLSESP